jgi:thioredoxin 1
MAIVAAISLLALGTVIPDRHDVCAAPSRGAAALCKGGMYHPQIKPAALLKLSDTVLRFRGGVREVEDRDDWESLQAEAADKLVVVDFTAVWCGPCQRIAPTFAELADEYSESAYFVKVDVDKLGELAAELGVTSMPTFLFMRGGEVIDSMRGADEAGLRALVAELASA